MEEGSVNLNIKNGIGTIEFYHPQSNSLPANVLKNLAQTIISSGKNKDIRVIILKSKGDRVFCAGASFQELSDISNTKQGKEFFMGFIVSRHTHRPRASGFGQGKRLGNTLQRQRPYRLADHRQLAPAKGRLSAHPTAQGRKGLATLQGLSLDEAHL